MIQLSINSGVVKCLTYTVGKMYHKSMDMDDCLTVE